MDLHAGAVPGNEAVPDGRMGKGREETLIRGHQRESQNGISGGREDGRNRGGLLYSD